jgi:hypothetical protein
MKTCVGERLWRPFAAIFAFGCLMTLWSLPAHALAEDVYTVRDVPVDATANEAAEARVIAIRKGRSTALRMLFQRLTLEVDWPELPDLETSEVTTLGAGFEISGERNSPTRYLATITYRFKPQDVRDILQQFDFPFSEVQARPMVVLPVFIEGENARIFQDDKNWSLAWANKNFAHELVPVKVPLGDLGDMISTPIEAALNDDYAALSGFAERYDVQDILIVRMKQPEPGGLISFEFVRLSPTETETWVMTVPNTRHIVPLMRMAIDRGLARMQEDWKARTIIRFDAQDTMVISARFEKISQWLVIKRAMQGTPNITDSRLVALSTGGAHMEWDVVGTPSQLALALAQHSVVLEPSKQGDEPTNQVEPEGLETISSQPEPWGASRRAQSSQGRRNVFGTDGDAGRQDISQWDQNGSDDYDPFGTREARTQDRVEDDEVRENASGEGVIATVEGWAEGVLETLSDLEGLRVVDGEGDAIESFDLDGSGVIPDPVEPLDPGAALALLPVVTEGGFYAANSDTQGTNFGNINPDFWIVRFAPEEALEVWPAEGEAGSGGAVRDEGDTGIEDRVDYATGSDGAY